MLKLIKYELIRKWRSLGIFLLIALGLNAGILFKIRTDIYSAEEQMLALAVFFSVMLGAFFLLFIIDVTVMYSRDLHHKSGYMFLLTPNSGQKLLGAKVLTGISEGFLFLTVYISLIAINFFGIYRQPFTDFLDSAFYAMISGQAHIHTGGVSLFSFLVMMIFTVFTSVVVLVLTIFAGISASKSILVEKKFGTLISFIFILLLGWLNGKITEIVYSMLYKTGILVDGSLSYSSFFSYIAIQIVLGIALFSLSAYLLDKKMDL